VNELRVGEASQKLHKEVDNAQEMLMDEGFYVSECVLNRAGERRAVLLALGIADGEE
jgi:hypothetical protein